MGSMRQLASMIRHVHEANGLTTAEDYPEDALLGLSEADLARLAAQAEPAGDSMAHALQQS